MSTPNPYVSAAVAEAKTAAAWVKAQVLSIWTQHKAATLLVAAAGALVGHVFH